MPVAPVVWWSRVTLAHALALHVAASLGASVWDAVVDDQTSTWTAIDLAANLLIEALFVWRLWARGRVAWWIGLVLQVVGFLLVPVQAADPVALDYPADTHPLEMLPLLLLTAAGLALWIAPSVRRHVRRLAPPVGP